MSNLLKTSNTSRLQEQQLSLDHWAQVRVKGKGQFVLRQAFSFAVVMAGLRDAADHIFDDAQVSSIGLHILQYGLIGIFVGYIGWWAQEAKYKNRRLN